MRLEETTSSTFHMQHSRTHLGVHAHVRTHSSPASCRRGHRACWGFKTLLGPSSAGLDNHSSRSGTCPAHPRGQLAGGRSLCPLSLSRDHFLKSSSPACGVGWGVAELPASAFSNAHGTVTQGYFWAQSPPRPAPRPSSVTSPWPLPSGRSCLIHLKRSVHRSHQ